MGGLWKLTTKEPAAGGTGSVGSRDPTADAFVALGESLVEWERVRMKVWTGTKDLTRGMVHPKERRGELAERRRVEHKETNDSPWTRMLENITK